MERLQDVLGVESRSSPDSWRDIGLNLCVVPFPNIYVPNFKLEDLHLRFSECLEVGGSEVGGSEVQRFGGLEVLV